MARWQALSARIVHLALYAFMVAMPLIGWLAISAKGAPVTFLGLNRPLLMGKNETLHDSLKVWHEVVGTAGYFLIGLHAAAALIHRYVMRDNTLQRMLPARR